MTYTILQGRVRCPVCATDQEWRMVVDPPTKSHIEEAKSRQNREVVLPSHRGHEKRLQMDYTTELSKD